MNHDTTPAYGLWPLVIINTAIFLFFAFSFSPPRTKRDWRSMAAFSAFIVALFTEMYGIPVTIYLLTPWLQSRFPGVDPLGHDAGHLLTTLLGWPGDPHWSPLHIASNVFIIAGFWIVASAWAVLHTAIRSKTLATSGPYAVVRHPQYIGFILVMFGFLLQWPTLITLVMFPVLVFMYWRLALSEERQVLQEFPAEYAAYSSSVPRFLPRLWGRRSPTKTNRLGAR
jgi:methanethiol S-methyltransferase